jgi:hypothetical protein
MDDEMLSICTKNKLGRERVAGWVSAQSPQKLAPLNFHSAARSNRGKSVV